MNIQKVAIQKLKSAKYNPRKELKPEDMEYQKIKASIEEFGYIDPIIVNIKNNTIIGGHQRVKVLKDLGYDKIDCVFVDLDEKQEKRLNLALNKITGIWDTEKLNELFNELELSNEELLATGFDKYELDNLTNDFIQDLLEEDFTDINNELDKFSITFNIDKYYKKKFDSYIKANGKDDLVENLIKYVEENEGA